MDNIVVFKVGGALLDNDLAALSLLNALKTIQQSALVVLVHGGGNSVERLLSQLNIPSEKRNGLRISPPEHMPYVTGALAGTTNKHLCALAYSQQINSIGLTLFDGDSVTCKHTDPELGSVGTPKANNSALLRSLLASGQLPIISSIGCSKNGELLNVNADQAATAIAQLLSAELYLLSDVPGVLDANKSLLPMLDKAQIEQLIGSGVIRDGMLVKVAAAQLAAESLHKPVIIGSWAETEALIESINSDSHPAFGTHVLPTSQD